MTNAELHYKKMTETPVAKLIVSMGIPTTISMLITNIYNMADTYFVGTVGESAQAATGVMFTLQAIIQGVGFMLGHGSGSYLSKSLADKDTDKASEYVSSAYYTAAIVGLTIMTLGLIFLRPMVMFFGSTETIAPHAMDYGMWILLSCPFLLCSLILNIGLRYEWKNYDWLYEAFNNMERIHREKPLDFCVQIGDNIDDGYADTYKVDYDIYLEEIKHLNLCDPESPLAPRFPDKIPHYEIQGNHDTSLDTRFFRNKLWFTENAQGQKVAYISFWASYGGYPLLNFVIGDGFNSYRSYGVLSDETVQFVEQCVLKAQAENAKQIILFSHFGISQMLSAPILPESGLGKIANLCKKYGIKLLFNGHEHTGSFPHRMFEEIHDFDVSMLRDKYAIVEIREKVATVIVYNTDDSTVYTTYRVNL